MHTTLIRVFFFESIYIPHDRPKCSPQVLLSTGCWLSPYCYLRSSLGPCYYPMVFNHTPYHQLYRGGVMFVITHLHSWLVPPDRVSPPARNGQQLAYRAWHSRDPVPTLFAQVIVVPPPMYPPGKGATFVITLPLPKQHEAWHVPYSWPTWSRISALPGAPTSCWGREGGKGVVDRPKSIRCSRRK